MLLTRKICMRPTTALIAWLSSAHKGVSLETQGLVRVVWGSVMLKRCFILAFDLYHLTTCAREQRARYSSLLSWWSVQASDRTTGVSTLHC